MLRRISKQVSGLDQNISLIMIICTTIAITWVNFNANAWNKSRGVVKHDIISYYAYLPAAIIYKDLSFNFIDANPSFFEDRIWVFKAPNGGHYLKVTMGLSFLYAPFFLAGHATAYIIGAEPSGYSAPYMFFLQFSSLFYLVLALFLLRWILKKHFEEWIVAIVLFSIVFTSNLFFYVTKEAAMPHAYNFFLFALFVWLTVKWHEQHKFKHAIALGLIFGLISIIRPSNALLALFFILYDVKSLRELAQRPSYFFKYWHHILTIVICPLFVFLPQLLFWKMNTGSWFFYSYGDEGFFFTNPQILNGLFSYRKGWLIYTPLMVFALVGIIALAKKHKQFFLPILVFTVLNIYAIYSWWCWWYGGSFGSRPMIDSYPLMAIALAGFIAMVSTTRRAKIAIIFVIFILSGFSVFQTQQYKKGAIHFDSMTKDAYWSTFGRWRPSQEFYDFLEPPDYNSAKKGIQAILPHTKATIPESMICDYEILTPDGNYFYSGDKRFFLGEAHFRSDKVSRSGNYSIKLTPENKFGSNLRLRARSGELFRLSVWKYPAESEGRIVFSAKDESQFYIAHKQVKEIDENLWGKIEFELRIPVGVHGHYNIYLLNIGAEAVYFDDLKIIRVNRN